MKLEFSKKDSLDGEHDESQNLVASNLEELLATIEKTIEPLLSGILLKHRPHLIPLLLSSSLLSSNSDSRDLFLKNLFNLIKVGYFLSKKKTFRFLQIF